MPDQATPQLAVEVAELRTELRYLAHDIKNALAKLDGAVSQRELAALEARLEARFVAMDGRLASLERDRSKLAWGIILSWLAGIAGLLGLKSWAGH